MASGCQWEATFGLKSNLPLFFFWVQERNLVGCSGCFGFVILNPKKHGEDTRFYTGDGILSVIRYQIGAGFVLFVRWLVGWKKTLLGICCFEPKK